MTKKLIIILSITIVVVLLIFMINMHRTDKTKNSLLVTFDNSVTSPSGKYLLKMEKSEQEGVKGFTISVVLNETKENVFVGSDFYRSRDTALLMWGDNDDTVWLYNGDVGTFYWIKTDNEWNKSDYTDDKNYLVPELLKELRPKYFE